MRLKVIFCRGGQSLQKGYQVVSGSWATDSLLMVPHERNAYDKLGFVSKPQPSWL